MALAALMFLTTCDGPVMYNPSDNELAYTNVEYSAGGGLLTLYLDGYAPVTNRQSRAINKELAQMGHNFFEVIFIYGGHDNGGNDVIPPRITRLSWKLGESARTSEVYRTETAINYGGITPSPAPGQGSALLFVGTSADKTLLAVGKLDHHDDGTGVTIPNGNISTATKSVTFMLNSLEAGLSTNPANSSFITAALNPGAVASAANTWIATKTIAGQIIPYYQMSGGTALEPGNFFSAEYHFGGIDEYIPNSIILADAGHVEKKQPRFTLNNGGVFTPPCDIDTVTGVFMENNRIAGEGFQNPVDFTIDDTYTPDGMAFALVFAVPVYALTGDDDTISGTSPVKWYIRPGFGTFMYDLDTGRDDGGGAIYMGTDDLHAVADDAFIYIISPPIKYTYSTSGASGLIFDLDGLVLELRDQYGTSYGEVALDDPNLSFYIGANQVYPGADIIAGLSGLIPVTVKYTNPDSGFESEAIFYIIVGEAAALTSLKAVEVYYDYDVSALNNSPTQVTILILMANVNIPDSLGVNPNPGPHRTLIVVAGTDGIVWGRGASGATHPFTRDNFTNLNSFRLDNTDTMYSYLGTWPFYSTTVTAQIGTGGGTRNWTLGYSNGSTHRFRVNAGGPYEAVTNPALYPLGAEAPEYRPPQTVIPNLPRYMFSNQYYSSGVIVHAGEGVEVINKDLLYYHVPLAETNALSLPQ